MNGLKSATLWIVIFMVFILMFVRYNSADTITVKGISEVFELAQAGKLSGKIIAKNRELVGTYKDKDGKDVKFRAKYNPGQEDTVLQKMTTTGVKYEAHPGSEILQQIVFSLLLPFLLF